MSETRPHRCTLLVAAMLLVGVALTPGLAEAGCLTEHAACRSCAQRLLKKAMWRLDLSGILDANIALWDCDIDLYHCIVLGQHHEAACTV